VAGLLWASLGLPAVAAARILLALASEAYAMTVAREPRGRETAAATVPVQTGRRAAG
jgi:hypothetical protein